jgi:hypothetical protein
MSQNAKSLPPAAGEAAHTPMIGDREGEIVVGIIYYRITRRRLWCPHSVFTTVPGSRYYSEYDFGYSKRDEVVCFHNSGSGRSFYLHPMCNRSGRNVAVWWDRSEATPTDGQKIGMRGLSDRTIHAWGYKILPSPLGLLRTEHINPLQDGDGYSTRDITTVWCKHCRSYIPDDSDDPCEHLTWNDGRSEFQYRRAALALAKEGRS